MMKQTDRRLLAGWLALGLSTLITCLWAFWGIVENFHEGWYYESLQANLGLMLAQYLSPMLIFLGVTLVSIFQPRFGAGLHVIIALLGIWFFRAYSNAAMFLIILPLIGISVLYWIGRIEHRKVAASVAIAFPLLTLIVSGAGPVIRVSQRIDDGNHQSRLVYGNGVDLIWAPHGPGWPREGRDWYDAQKACDYLSADGLTITSTSQGIWRLPTVDEAVRSMARHGSNSGGVWHADMLVATYETTPDKESPLWDVHSQVIYWWTATEADEERSYIIVYDGKVWPRSKVFSPAYLGFRCVKFYKG